MDKKSEICLEIIEDENEIVSESLTSIYLESNEKPGKKLSVKNKQGLLKSYFHESPCIFEIGVDEAGRGPLFGPVYTAAVILPKDDSFDHSKMKDSKKFHSKKKILETAEYIKSHAISWSITCENETTIDNMNILQATQSSMHKSILETMKKNYTLYGKQQYKLLIDGNYFKPFSKDNSPDLFCSNYESLCIEGGDNTYSAIAAASILAKVARDNYISNLCEENPELSDKYGIDSNKGYGAKKHIDGIREHGITKCHRRTFGICKLYV